MSEGVLWLSSLSGLTCADRTTGNCFSETIQSEAIEAEAPVASDHVLYAEAPAGGIVAITPPAPCWVSDSPDA